MENISYPLILTLMVPKDSKSYQYVYFSCFLLLYLLILWINIHLILVIITEKALHEPMYVFVCFLCMNVVYGASGFYPKFLFNLIMDSYVISSHMCALQTFVIYSSLLCEFTILTVMSYDRYVAICKPLEYHSKLTKSTCVKLILLSWLVPNICVTTAVLLANLRPFCKNHIDKFYCDNWSTVKLSCTPSFVNNVYGYIVAVIFLSCVAIIIVSYVKLVNSCKASIENKRKFWQTCLPHVILLINFTFTLLFDIMYSRYGTNEIPESLQCFLALELVTISPVINPLVYGLNVTAVRRRICTLCFTPRVNVSGVRKRCK